MNSLLTPEILRRETCFVLSNMTDGFLHHTTTQHQFRAEFDQINESVRIAFVRDGLEPLTFSVPRDQLLLSLEDVDQTIIAPRCAEMVVALLPPEVLNYWAA